jgi:RNA polymerase sigma factor (sigma-70 family)
MAMNPVVDMVERVRRSALLREGEDQTDGQLLERFVRQRDNLALEILVQRHAPMVWGVCRRTLSTHHDAEDAFQATFLVLVRKAASIRSRELLANWLYRVALKTARKARQMAEQRAKTGGVLPEPEPAGPPDGEFGPEWWALLHKELSRLPEKYRIVIALCELEGRTRPEVARQLRVPEGTVGSRLARARALLARRLTRRGLSLSATSLAAVLSAQAASGAVPAALIKATTLLAAGGTAAASAISTQVATLTEGALKSLGLAKYKAAGLLLLTAALVLGSGMAVYHVLAGSSTRQGTPPGDPGRSLRAGMADPPQDDEARIEADPNRFGNAEDAAGFAAVVAGGGRGPGAKAVFDPKTKHWRVTGTVPGFRPHPAITWEAEVSYSPFCHGWQSYMSKPKQDVFRNSVKMPVTFAELRSMPEILFAPWATDEELGYFQGLRALRTLGLRGRITDIGLDKLRDLPNLRTLSLTECSQITDKGLVALEHLPNVETLKVFWTPVTDECLKHVASLQHLRDLKLANTKVTGEGFRYLGGIHELSSLDLSDSPAPLSLKEIKHLKNLKELNLAHRLGITNESLKDLKQLKNLTKLDLSFTGVTDAGLAELQDLKSLRRLTLSYEFKPDEPIVDPVNPKPVNERVLVRKFREAMKWTAPECVIDIQYDPKRPKGKEGDEPQPHKGEEDPKKGR